MELKRGLFIVIAANLVALVALAFVYPQLMISPGPVVAGHAEIATDCFACHAPWRGAESTRCITCHALPDIGLRTSKGVQIAAKKPQQRLKASFHQDLLEQDCMACHSDHQGPKLTHRSSKRFSHALLRPAVQQQCEGCHQQPTDSIHQRISGDCQACHRQQAWKPATFDHAELFVLDRDHQTPCITCHQDNDYKRYTCYGCHEHTAAKVRAEHEEEGIRNFDNCVECHRDPGVQPDKSGRAGERRQ